MTRCRSALNQQGMALVTVLLIFSVVTLMASRMVTGLFQQTRQSSHYLERMQARLYALGAEQFIALKLEEDARMDREQGRPVDHLNEAWNHLTPGYVIDEGHMRLTVMDQQGRLNINNLAAVDSRATQSLEVLRRLLTQVGLSDHLAYAIKDWVDSDREVSPGGAEDPTYLQKDPPYRAGNTPMVSLSELLLVHGFTRDVLDRLHPLIAVLPESTEININTAPRAVLSGLSSQLTATEVDALIEARSDQGIANWQELLQIPALTPKATVLQSLPLTFSSRHFSAVIEVTWRGSQYRLYSGFQRNDQGRVFITRRTTSIDNDGLSEQGAEQG